MKTHRTLKSAVAIAVLGTFLAACSGGGSDQSANQTTTKPTTTTPTTTNPFTAPPISSGPMNVGASGNEAIDNIATDTGKILDKLGTLQNSVNEANSNAKKAASNSNWAKWLGVGIASAIGLQMIRNGIVNGKETGSFMKGLGGFFFNSTRDADQKVASDLADAKQAEYEATAARLSTRSDARAAKLAGAAAKIGGATIDRLDQFNAGLQSRDKGIQDGLAKADATGPLNRMQSELNSTRTSFENVNAQKQRELDAMTKQRDAKAAEASSLQSQIDTAKGELVEAQRSGEANGAKVAELQKKIGDLEAQQRAANANVASIQSQLQSQQTDMATALREYESFTAEIASADGSGENLGGRIMDSKLPQQTKRELLNLLAKKK